MKYIILMNNKPDQGYSRAFPIIFPEYMTHSVVALGTIFAHDKEEKLKLDVLSAGICFIDPRGNWSCERGSGSLNIKRSKELSKVDERILNLPEAFQGIMHI